MPFTYLTQQGPMDCGHACLRMIAKYFGKDYQSKHFKSFSKVKETSMLELSDVAKKLGLRTLGVKVSLKKLVREAPLPCILHWNQNHFVVLYAVKRNPRRKVIFSIADPALGIFHYKEEEVIKHWYTSESESEGVALLFETEN